MGVASIIQYFNMPTYQSAEGFLSKLKQSKQFHAKIDPNFDKTILKLILLHKIMDIHILI